MQSAEELTKNRRYGLLERSVGLAHRRSTMRAQLPAAIMGMAGSDFNRKFAGQLFLDRSIKVVGNKITNALSPPQPEVPVLPA